MTLALRQMTIEDAKILVSQAASHSVENLESTASALGISLSQESAAFLAGLTAASNENSRQSTRIPSWL